MSNIVPTPANPWQETLMNYLMGGMDPSGMQPSFYPAQLGGLWGYMPAAMGEDAPDADTGTTNYLQDIMQMQMDPALWAQAGPMAFDPMAFEPTNSYEVIDQPGTRALMQYLNRPGTIEYEIAYEILNRGGTASSAIGRMQMAYDAAQANPDQMTPEEQALFAQIPPSNDPLNPGPDWASAMARAQDLEAAALADPQPGSGAVYDASGNMITGGGQRQMMFDELGNPQLVETTSTPSPMAEWAREQGLSLPTEQYTPEMLLGEDWMRQQENYFNTQAMIDAAMEQWLGAQGPIREGERRERAIRDTRGFFEEMGGDRYNFPEGATGENFPGRGAPELGEATGREDIFPNAARLAQLSPGQLAILGGMYGAQAVAEGAEGARDLAGVISEPATGINLNRAVTNPGALLGAGFDYLFGRTASEAAEEPSTSRRGYEGTFGGGEFPAPSPAATWPPTIIYDPWREAGGAPPVPQPASTQRRGGGGPIPPQPSMPPDVITQAVQNYLGQTAPPQSETAPWNPPAPPNPAAIWPPTIIYDPWTQAGGAPPVPGEVGGGGLGGGGRRPQIRGYQGPIRPRGTEPIGEGEGEGEGEGGGEAQPTTSDQNVYGGMTPEQFRDYMSAGNQAVQQGATPADARQAAQRQAAPTVPTIITGERMPAVPPPAPEPIETGEMTTEERERRRRRGPTSAQLQGRSLVTPPQSERGFMGGSQQRRSQIREAQRALWSQREQIWGEDYGRAAAVAYWAQQNGVTPFQQQMLARRMVPLAMGVPQTSYLPGR